jgi:hypothetical protein
VCPLTTLYSSQDRHQYFSFQSDEDTDRPATAVQNTPKASAIALPRLEESGSDSADRSKSRKGASDPDSTPKAKLAPKTSIGKLKSKSGVEPALENMTVETETVSSIPQAALGPPSDRAGASRDAGAGTLRVKASNETIRPKKDRKKAARKAPSINTASGKCLDLFKCVRQC